MAVWNYDPAEVIVTIGGVQLFGFADGTFLTIARDEQAFQKVTGADGRTSRAKSNNRGALVTITLKQTSPSNDVLSGFAVADEATNTGVVPMTVTDLSGRTLAFAESAWVQQIPNADFAKEISNRAWAIDCAAMSIFLGGNELGENGNGNNNGNG